MGKKQSQNTSAKSYFTYDEKRRMGFGTKTQRFGGDATRKFGVCGLCLQPARDPVATKYGTLYCKSCILENLLDQKKEIKWMKKDAMRRDVEDEITREREAAEHQQKEEQALSRMDGTALPESDAIFSREHQLRRAVASGAASSLVQEEETKRREAEIMRERRREAVMKTKEEKMAELKSYWIVNFTPENGKEDGKEILPVTVDPLVRKHLRLKQLYPLELSRPGGEEGEGSHFMCPSCKADIGYQQCYALTQCRHVLCQQCYKMCVVPDKQCPICSAAAPPKTIIKLEKGGSSFASHNSVQVSVYAPAKT